MGEEPRDRERRRDNHALDVEQPQHHVTITKGFMIGQYPCTQEVYESIMGANPSAFSGGKRPVEHVSWCDAIVFCNALSQKEGLEPAGDTAGTVAHKLSSFDVEGSESHCSSEQQTTGSEIILAWRPVQV